MDVKNCISNSGEDAVVVEASLVDERGQFVPCASQRVFFTSEEQGEILAVSGGDPKDHEPAKAHDKKMFNGRVQAIIKVKEGSRITSYNVCYTKLLRSSPLLLIQFFTSNLKSTGSFTV